ncbi:zinc finger protein 385D isoform X2 [Denticeps clupeoides]|uniref:zinc finger protein 385D isoform X2 n=1 Tax=Denticeps clupeoides TaxID=299321 RepID=UPI0010A4808B|nr:zinc finger protein 385D-like isoform X2 [Denticeps clupeoides]
MTTNVCCGPVSLCSSGCVSMSQALAHYKGTKHAKKLKALDAPKCKEKGFVNAREVTSKDISKNLIPPAIPHSAERKEPSSGVPLPPTSPSAAMPLLPVSCQNKGPETTSALQGEDGPPLLTPPAASPPTEADVEADAEEETEEEKARRLLYCSLCKVAVNSTSQLEAHNSGTKHKTMLEARSGIGSIKSYPRAGLKSKLAVPTKTATGLQNKTFHCETCDVHVNSETQLKQHISSRRHKDRAAGKPAKPKYSPYTKPLRGQTKQPVKVPLSKELCQALPTRIIPSHLAAMAAAAAAAVNSTFPIRASHSPSPFQTQSLSAALLRAAPGPIRTAHTSVLFAPY